MSDKSDKSWEQLSRDSVYKGFYRIDKLHFRHTLFEGGWSPTVDREMFVRGDVTAVLPYDSVNDTVALVEQFRIGAMNQKPNPWLMEVIAGMIEPGETPEEVAVRESKEEAGLELDKLELIAHYLASPGSTTEEVFIYYAETDLSNAGGVFGLESETEDIRLHIVKADDAIAMLDSREIKNAISVIALQWFKNQRLQKVT